MRPANDDTWYLLDELAEVMTGRWSKDAIDRADRILGALATTASGVLRRNEAETSKQGALRAKDVLDVLRSDDRRPLGQVVVEAKLAMLVNVLASESIGF